MKKLITLVILFISHSFFLFSVESRLIETPYGPITITEPILLDLIDSAPMQRLKKIHQYGILSQISDIEAYSRYDHSIGVFALLRLYGLPLQEQVAGLLHDVSHTAFSHVGDFLYSEFSGKDSYQDNIHQEYLRQAGIDTILAKHQFPLNDALHKNKKYLALEQDLPNMCADRIDYNIAGALRRGLINEDEAQQIITDLRFKDGNWYFTSAVSAKLFAELPLNMTVNIWASPESLISYSWMSELLQVALKQKIITAHDVHFSSDDIIWGKLLSQNNKDLLFHLTRLVNYNDYYTINEEAPDTYMCGKFRGINPLVMHQGMLVPLTQIDAQFSKNYNATASLIKKGWPVKFKMEGDPAMKYAMIAP